MKPWKRDLFGSGWFGDYYYSCNCCACVGAEIAESLGKSACSWFLLYYCCCWFLPCLIFSQRGSMRQKYGLHGKYDDRLDDKLTYRWCMQRLLVSFLLWLLCNGTNAIRGYLSSNWKRGKIWWSGSSHPSLPNCPMKLVETIRKIKCLIEFDNHM